MLAAVLGGAIVSGYALALWWLLRREEAWTCAALAGLVPGLASASFGISGQRILMAYLFFSLAAAAALNPLPWRRRRVGAAALPVGLAGLWSVGHYVADSFWPPKARSGAHTEMTARAETAAESPPARLFAMTPAGRREPAWDGVTPLLPSGEAS